MPNKKRKIFTKDNSVKFVLLRGNSEARNADGEILENALIPVPSSHKPGSSLLMSKIADFCGSLPKDNEANLENLIDQFDDDFDTDDKVQSLVPKMKQLCCKQESSFSPLAVDKNTNIMSNFSSEDEYFDVSDQFSNADTDSDRGEYLLSSMTPDCPTNVKIFNERFEKVLEEYDDDQIGPLDDEEICGNLSVECERVKDLIDTSKFRSEEIFELGNVDECIKEKIRNYVESDDTGKYVEIITEKPLEYDCESILSTYSNIFNHPTVIKEESKIEKIRIPRNPLQKKLTKSDLKNIANDDSSEESDDNFSIATSCNIRPKGETPEERRERKSLFKEAKRESRVLKKENKLAFKDEKKRLERINMNAQWKRIKLL